MCHRPVPMLLWAAGLFACMPAVASDPEEDPSLRWQVSVAGQYDQLHSTSYDAGVHYMSSSRTTWSADVSHSRWPTSDSAISTDAASLEYSRKGQHVDFSLGVDIAKDVGVVRGDQVTVSMPVHGSRWHVEPEASARRSSFDPFGVSAPIRLPSGGISVVRGTASCTLNDQGYGAEAGLDGQVWSSYVKGVGYHYGSTDCTFDIPALNALGSSNRQQFRQISGALTRRLSALGGRRAGANGSGAYLSSDFIVGFKYLSSLCLWGAEVERSRDHFEGLKTDAVTLSAEFDVLKHSDLEIRLGSYNSQSVGAAAFAVVELSTRF